MMKRILCTALLIAAAAPAAAQGTGVECVAATLSPEQLESLSARWISEEIGPMEVNDEIRPGIRSCIDRGVIVTQGQLDSSFVYAISVLEMFDYGKDLQSVGIDPSQIEGLWAKMPPALRSSVIAHTADQAPLPEEELKAYLAANSMADENGKLGTALVFMLAIAGTVEADRKFTEAKP